MFQITFKEESRIPLRIGIHICDI